MLEPAPQPRDYAWPFWPVLPLYPFGQRRTLRQEVVKGRIWTFEQLQGIFYVVTPIRMTVIKLDPEGLLVYAPVAPTRECLRLLHELVAEYGTVKYIILPTISGLEHKVFVGPFARCFAAAQVFVAPGQWSFPLNLPLSWLGLPRHRTQILPPEPAASPFGDRFDYALLGPLDLGLGRFGELALFDRETATLMVTDAVVSISNDPPPIANLDPYPLLFHARDQGTEPLVDTLANRRKGWQRICLFALYFAPSTLEIRPWGEAFRQAFTASDRSKRGYFGLFPFQWQDNWHRSFELLRADGQLFVAPILQTLILNRAPQETLEWANQVASWQFQQIIPCHFSAPIFATPEQFRLAFSFLAAQLSQTGNRIGLQTHVLPEEDFQLLRSLDMTLTRWRISPPKK